MNKISFRIDYASLNALVSKLEDVPFHFAWSREEMVVASIIDDILKKLMKKCISKKGEAKPFKITLEYYQAFALEKACRQIFHSRYPHDDQFLINVALMVANEIDKQL